MDKTCKYLAEQNCECGVITLETAEILGYIKAFCTYPIFPTGADVTEYNPCRIIAEGLFYSAVRTYADDKKSISYGWIRIAKGGYEISFDMKDFDTAFEFCISFFCD